MTKKETRIRVELENGNVVYASSTGDMLEKAALQNTRVRDYHYEDAPNANKLSKL